MRVRDEKGKWQQVEQVRYPVGSGAGALGKNGYYPSWGLNLVDINGRVTLNPITQQRKQSQKCAVELPRHPVILCAVAEFLLQVASKCDPYQTWVQVRALETRLRESTPKRGGKEKA